MIEREAETSALAGPLVNAGARSEGFPPWAPTPGSSRTDCGSSRRASATSSGKVAPITAPTAERPPSPTRSSPHSPTSCATCCQRSVPSERRTSCTSAPPAFDVFTRQKSPAPSRRHAARNGSSASRPRYGLTVTASASAGSSPRGSTNAAAYARAVDPMSPRFASAITSSSAFRPYSQTSSSARMPSAPSASKNADCGFTATAYGATASMIPQQKRAQAEAACSRPSTVSPRSSTGSWSMTGSRPTTTWLRLRSTASAMRSAKCVNATRATASMYFCPRNARGAAFAAPSRSSEETCPGCLAAAALDCGLERAAGRELRDLRGRDVHLLARVTGIDACASRAVLARELAETGEGNVTAALQRVRDRLEERVDRLARIARRQLATPRDLVHKLLLGHVPLLLSLIGSTGLDDPTRGISPAQPCGFAGLFASPEALLPERSGAVARRGVPARPHRPLRGRRRTPPSGRRDRLRATPRSSRATLRRT